MNDNTKFKEGDLVRLKSGGPLMTYGGESMTGEAICKWFDKTNEKSGNFGHALLEKSEKPRPSSSIRTSRG
jgi:uncharacterized protein YodC (DUF2158 family)